MTPYKFHPTLLVRTPVYPYHAYAETAPAEILKQPLFKKAIWFASEAFYRELEKCDFEYDRLDKKAKNTVKKYINRMHYRPTPFGLCSAFGVLSWGVDRQLKFSASDLRPHVQLSFARNAALAQDVVADSKEALIYRLNGSVYKAGKEYRFVRSAGGAGQIEFMIDSLPADRFFGRLVAFLGQGRKWREISEWVCEKANCSAVDAEQYVEWLAGQQLIQHHLEPNVTGTEHLDRVLKNTGRTLPWIDEIKGVTTIDDLETGASLSSRDSYLNTEVKLAGAGLDERFQQDILDGVECLEALSAIQEPPAIKRFKSDFIQKFERKAMPLLVALDPEVGVGYGDLEDGNDDTHLLRGLASSPTERGTTINWGKVHSLLLGKWHHDGGIILTPADIEELGEGKGMLPQSISVMFRISGRQFFMEQAGGVSANALIGRFTPFNEDIHRLAKDMAVQESMANPDVLFAEIVHICNEHTANIDRRKHIYEYEIPVLAQSELPREQQIPLNDLWVSVQQGKVILWSKEHGKRVIPRLSSAFNYTRNDLAVFRFLCDMQHAEIRTNLGFKIERLFPGLAYYPRVSYRNTILQPACWNIKQAVFSPAIMAADGERQAIFNKIRTELKIPRFVALTEHDNQLVFDLDKDTELAFLLDTIKDMSQVTLKEFLMPNEDQCHVGQFIASLYHTGQIYQPFQGREAGISNSTAGKYLPGSEWLYLKLYCHPIRANELLKGPLYDLTRHCIQKKLGTEWFFIRYTDPDHHIRLRIRVAAGHHQQVLEKALGIVEPLVNEGLISKYSIDTYEQELERYGPETIAEAEAAFYASSMLNLAFLRKSGAPSANDVLLFALVTVRDMLRAAGLKDESAEVFLHRMFNSFFIEFSNIADLKHQLDMAYRRDKALIEDQFKEVEKYYIDMRLKSERALFIKSINNYKDSDKRMADLVHMHLNRLFVTDPRKQEMAIYYFLLKYERSVLARKKLI
jgi:thiopeptide-type bacteriocin biosynthesis protein